MCCHKQTVWIQIDFGGEIRHREHTILQSREMVNKGTKKWIVHLCLLLSSLHLRNFIGGRGTCACAGWSVWDLGKGTIMLRKANWKKTLQRSLNFSDGRKSIQKQIVVEKSFNLILCLFGFLKAMKFRDSSKYSQCVQNVLAKSCLPYQIYKPKKFCWTWKGLGTLKHLCFNNAKIFPYWCVC